MKEKPIIFSPEMVRAILAKQKTQTRRVIKPQIQQMEEGFAWWHKSLPAGHCHSDLESVIQLALKSCPYGKVGDRLWVREAFFDHGDGCYEYKESPWIRDRTIKGQWKPAMYMPRAASRITLEVTDIRVERIQEITEADAIAEGVTRIPRWNNDCYGETHSEAFSRMWSKMHNKTGFGWNQNPFVWVVGFKVIERSGVSGSK